MPTSHTITTHYTSAATRQPRAPASQCWTQYVQLNDQATLDVFCEQTTAVNGYGNSVFDPDSTMLHRGCLSDASHHVSLGKTEVKLCIRRVRYIVAKQD